MKGKTNHRLRFQIIVGILLVFIILLAVIFLNIPRHQNVSDSNFDLTALADGTYSGECDNGLVAVEVAVEVEKHSITYITILKHQNGMGQSAESITEDVIGSQSVEVDTISQATLSSQTILKAIENALSS